MKTEKEKDERLRALPSVDRVLALTDVDLLVRRHGRDVVRDAVRGALDDARSRIRKDEEPQDLVLHIAQLAAARARTSLREVLNATGVVLHTNLGRAPLAASVARHAATIAAGYSTLELDLETGERGSRQSHAGPLIAAACGAEDAIVVNNCAAAVLLVATALGSGREVIVSRGELVEIGGKFRVPDVLAACGARLVEVGTTNRTRRDDYARAMGPATAMLMKVHRSNFAIVGFTEETSVAELVTLAAREPGESRPVVVFDAGSGAIADGVIAGVMEPTVAGAVKDGADLVTFSGDKLLGGPQAGIVVGRAELVDRLRSHPLMRALRPGKLELAALEATLALMRDGRADEIPTRRAIAMDRVRLRAASERIAEGLTTIAKTFHVEVIAIESKIGGGASPLGTLHGAGVAIRGAPDIVERLASELRLGDPPVIGRVHEGALVIDPRTLLAVSTDDEVLEVVARLVREAALRVLE